MVLKSGIRVLLGDYVVYFRRETGEAPPKLAIQVSKRVGNAVQRNRIRRRIKEICRDAFPRMSRGIDFVFIVRTGARKKNFQETRMVLTGFFEREKLMNGPQTRPDAEAR